jgi:hypothetical protein
LHFYNLRFSNGGIVPVSEEILSGGEPVSREVIAGVCRELADIALIEWGPNLSGHVIGSARIRGPGVAAVERGESPSVQIRFPNKAAAAASGQPAPQAAPASDDGIPDATLAEIREAIAEIRSQLPAIVTSNATKAEIESDVAQISTELERLTPRRKFLKTFLESLRDNLAKAASGARASYRFLEFSPRRSGTRTRAAPMRAPRRNSSIGLRRRASRSSRRSRACMSRPTSSS